MATARADGVPEPDAARAALMATAKADWPEWEREQPLLVLDPDREVWRGIVSKTGDGEKQVGYDRRVGFRLVAA
ncbi:MAG: hypothetical protein ACKVP7_02945 [Hyphomicrobiaceae bacterium]